MSPSNSIDNEYLALREAKIKRNNERLQELGLASSGSRVAMTISSSALDKKKQDVARLDKFQPVIIRRSSRTRSVTVDDAKDDTYNNEDEGTKAKKRKRVKIMEDDNKNKSISSPKVIIQSEAKPGTTRATVINITKVLCGDFNYPVFIGHQLASTGKASVIEHANLLCRNDVGISFNKYNGVCEWKNDAVFLWVNIGSPDADVKNEFFQIAHDDSDKGMQMTWYGGSRMTADSNVIQKLVTIGQKAANDELSPSDGIVLWCRLYNKEKKTFGPYACLGRLSYYSHDANVQPIQFVWNLMDYNILSRTSKNDADNVFQQIIDHS